VKPVSTAVWNSTGAEMKHEYKRRKRTKLTAQKEAQYGKELVDFATLSLNVTKHHIIKTARGKGGGTYAHKNVALAYAKYLSPELHMQVNDVYLRAASGDVTLAEQIFDKAKIGVFRHSYKGRNVTQSRL
jgi:KilA-N domain